MPSAISPVVHDSVYTADETVDSADTERRRLRSYRVPEGEGRMQGFSDTAVGHPGWIVLDPGDSVVFSRRRSSYWPTELIPGVPCTLLVTGFCCAYLNSS